MTASTAPDDLAILRGLVSDWQANGNSRPLGDPSASAWQEAAAQLLLVLDRMALKRPSSPDGQVPWWDGPRCLHCGDPIKEVNYALGPKWVHFNPSASFGDSDHVACRITQATPR